MLVLACLLVTAAAAPLPATYDQRQDGELNFYIDVKNVMLLAAIPTKNIAADFFLKNVKLNRESEARERADVQVMEAFVEPSEPYHVEIGGGRQADGDGRAVEVVIAARRRPNDSLQAEPEPEPEPAPEVAAEPAAEVAPPAADNEYKLIGATEQCGPDRERDPVTLTCRTRAAPHDPQPEQPDHSPAPPQVVPAST